MTESFGPVPMWEILVPVARADGVPHPIRFHGVWDARVRAITGGLTVLPPSKGSWVSPSGKLQTERMIPVRIMCSPSDMATVARMTLEYYEQEAVLYYKVSSEAHVLHRD